MEDLKGHVALVAGGGRDAGEAIALQLSNAGAAVGVIARTNWNIDQVANAICDQGGRALSVAADFSNPTELANACDEVMKKFGVIDILINNPSTFGPLGPFAEIDIEYWIYTNNVTMQAPIRLTRLLLPIMMEQGWGRVINVSSGYSPCEIQGETYNAFIASKAGVEGHTLNLAEQLQGTGVTVNAMRLESPQMAREANVEQVASSIYQRLIQRKPRGQSNTPEVQTVELLDLIHGDLNGEVVNTNVFAQLATR